MNQTADEIIAAAGKLLDEGGASAVTLRAVAKLVGVSHNAPYRHFTDRSALLAAVAERDFLAMRDAFSEIRKSRKSPLPALKAAVGVFVEYGRAHPARYRLLFSDPEIGVQEGPMKVRAMETFHEFGALVANCQESGVLPKVDVRQLTALLYACMHGLVDIELGGRARSEKGLGDIEAIVFLLLTLLSQSK